MRVLVIGGTGFIGAHVVRRLHAFGHDVTLFHRGQHEVDFPVGVRHVHGAWLGGLADFVRSTPRPEVDVVLFTRAIGESDTRFVRDTVRTIGHRIVALSSIDVYRAYGRLHGTEPGAPEPVPLTEGAVLRERLFPYRDEIPRAPDQPPRWQDDYEKILVERALAEPTALPATILRLPMVYGPGDSQHRFFPWLKRMDDRRPAILLDAARARWRASYGYVENVAAAISLAVLDDRAAGRIYNVGDDSAPTEAQWVELIGEVAGWDGKVATLPRGRLPPHLVSGLNFDQPWVIDTTRMREDLGYAEEVSRREALQRTIDGEREHAPEHIDPRLFDYVAEDEALTSLS